MSCGPGSWFLGNMTTLTNRILRRVTSRPDRRRDGGSATPRQRLRAVFIATGLLLGAVVATVATNVTTTFAASEWYDGVNQYSGVVNCVSIIQGSPYVELGASASVGFYADPTTNKPSPNVPYYVHVVVAGLGNSCSGQRVDVNVQLPANTTFAISGTNPVVCAYDGVQVPAGSCPQSLPSSAGTYGAGFYRVPSTDSANANLWPLPLGRYLTIAIPVVTSTAISNSTLTGAVRVLDGNSSPLLVPTVGVYVFDNTPAIVPIAAGTTFGSVSWPTTIKSETYLYPNGQGGNGYFDLMTSSGGSVVFTDGPAAVPAGTNQGYKVWADWTPYAPGGLAPNTTYYWRVWAENACGTGAYSAVYSFSTVAAPGDCGPGLQPSIVLTEGFEGGANGWTLGSGSTGNTWALWSTNVHSGSYAYHAAGSSAVSDQRLVSPPIVVPSSQSPVTLKFWNRQVLELSLIHI